MHLHQVLTGAVNPGDNCYSVGSVGDVPFTAYGSGCDIVILANDFECVQIIPGAKHGNIQVSCVECSNQQGRIAASYGNAVCIFEPLGINSHKRNCQLKCQWLKTGQFFLSSVTYNLAWDPQDNRLLTATDSIQLWAPPGDDILEEEEEIDNTVPPVLNDWKCVWQCKTSVSVHLMEWSPDGEYFATAGKDDCLLKVWYPMTGWKSSIIPQDHHEVKRRQSSTQFSFVYLAHPRAVTGFSWRKTSKYMPRGSVCNVLLTSCHDGVCRLWAETLLPEDCLLGEQICETTTSSIASSLSHAGRHKDRIQHALETIHHLKNLRKGQRRSSVLVTHAELMPDQTAMHEVQRHISHHANALCHFHIAASINPATDIPNVLVGTAFNVDDGNGGFVVHWLNNKEFHFTSSTEVFMHQLRKLSDKQVDHENDDADREDEEHSQEDRERGLHMKLDHDLSLDRESEAGTGSSEHEDGEREGSPRTYSRLSVPMPLPTVLLDRKIETLLTEWNKNPDMLFTIHPVDGTFLVWHVKYLDEYNPGIFRQVQVSFSSRIPVAFPSGDASSLSKNIMMYACINATKDSHHTLLHQEGMSVGSPHGSQPHSRSHSTHMNILAPTVMMISKHIDGSLNQWAVTFADKSAFTTVLTVSHKFRYCGHRFHLNDLACHSVLPLLLTSSHHNALLTPELDCQWDSDNKLSRLMDPVKHIKGSSKQPLRNAATRTFHDPNAIYSELILWRVDPIGPLSYTGGVSELARINSLHTSAFSNVAWLPTLIPSYCLGTYCNSASACFVASDGKNLRLYQAVVDARKLLDELSDPESSKLIGEVFNIVSQQSTARPGCIIELDAITNQCGSNTQLLHVFQEDFIIGYKPHKEDMEKKETEIFFQPSQGYRPPPFSEKFFLVVIEKDSNNNSILHMWHLHLKSVQACLGRDTLDECGLRYLLAMRLHTCLLTSLPPLYRVQLLHQGVSTCHFAWAFHSEAEEELINMIPAIQRGDPQWSELRAMGIGWWVRNINTLRRCIEKVAKASFQRNNDALDAALFYLSMKKKAVVWGLFRSQHDEKMTTFFSHNFNEDRWRKAALKNAFSLLGKQRFEQSAAFFLLAGSLKDAIEVCLEKMEDIQLAMVIARLYESEFETSSTYISILNQKILGCQKDGSGFSCKRLHPDPFLRSLAYWVMKDYTRALDTLLEQTPKEDDEHQVIIKSCNPVAFSFYNYLRTHPLLIRRNLASPEGTLATLGLKTEKNFVDKINLIERKLFFTTANAHFKVGCPVLALEVLSKIPKVTKTSALSAKKDQPDFISHRMDDVPSHSKALSDGNGSSGIEWSNVTSSQYDWSQPIVKVDEEPLNLDWGEDHDSALDEEEDDAVGLVMKSTDAREKDKQSDQKASDPNMLLTPQEEDDPEGDTEVDVIAEQLKFRACLKILMTELRTLATGYEVDGGKLRFQLYNWLEKEIAALHEICNHESVIKEYSSKTYSKVESDLLDQEEMVDKPDIGSYERHQIERRRLQAKREHAERRKSWLQKNQDLLRVFLSYCSLHGAQGGGLASVRMELKFLLQESQQETTVKQLQSPLPLPTTLPLLSASIASTKTVIANPVLYLNNHIHDILYTIVQMKTPPHPSIEDVKVHTLHSLAASLSASIYQALCDSHSYSQTEGNQFTGMAYQGLLLSDRRRLRTESIEEHATPNSSPAQWPGVSSLINLLSSAQDEDQPKLNILLCEAVVAVYLSLLIHALATNSSSELFRLAAHPLNNRMWAAVFGGGVKLVVKPRRQSENISAPPVLSEDIDKHRRRFNMRMLVPGRPVKDATPPPVPAERPSYKEKFIPPELSMWDYFVAKPFLPLSDSGVIYDSDESIHSDEEDDAFFSDTQIQEHQDPNSYSWALLHLTMVKLALHNVKNFFPIAGLEFSELPVTSPLGIAVIKNLENWEQILQEKMDQFEGPPPNYINTYPTDLSVGAGPAILRNKAMLEPENTPFKSRDSSAFPVKRLWHFLVKQEVLQETFIRYIFTKKRKQSEVEADLGYPGGKAKVIHKESDMIMAFSVNKANCNEIVLASTHDVQELDVTSLLACQSYIWIGEEYDRESKSSDDVDYRGSTTTLYQPSATSYSASQVHPPSSLPWLGTGQTSTGASVLMKRNLHNVKRMTSHPVHQYYLTGAQDGSVRMFEWTRPQQLVCFRQAGNARVTRLYFNSQGNKCGVADGEGFLSIWQVNQTASNPKPYMSWQCHSKATSDFAFITSSSLVATSGHSNDNRNVCLWDTLISPGNSLIHGFTCHDHGATVLQYAPKQQLLISGGRKGHVCIFDIRQRQLIHTFQAHDSAIKALALDPYEEYFTTGSAEGNIKVWRLTGHGLIHSFKSEHAKQSIFRNIGAGVMQIDIIQGNRLFSCGADGTLKTRVLPNAFNIPNRILDIL
ncbi:dmX-like protein 2 isoform 3 [Homo sapiens]|uniref:Isoform 2 of DmX-like protein 2 n=1 Tax=Homo sapiens TaxID=9606 RepID=Q8TDJ6-2|nr:dmX-like protein 2 isoform 3 [Homo sapiens]AAI40782.1 DMXL2 protein [Homo sapiens]KAI2574225.1 Dmx like 2 [Homo sapiens]|eukprot:NP_001167588.1 dmX-like protein 2 isoform 3 [Homo sapiens]